jgi:splicing factor 3A subunit 1
MTTCTICGQQIAVDELDEHMRIELLDPKWKSQRDIVEGRKAQASELQRGANVVSSLKNLARSRVDIFGGEAEEERRKRQEEEEREKRKEREKVVWDGHTASKEGTLSKYQTNVNFDEQIAAIHRAKGLGPYVCIYPFSIFCAEFSYLIAKRPMPSVQASGLLLPQHP